MSIVSMNERVEMEKGNRKPSEVTELNLDNSKATEIEGLTDKFENLEHLSLVNIGLQSLNGLPNLPQLKKIDFADNRLSGNLEVLLNCPNLEQISLSGNKIKLTETLAPLSKLEHLRCLDLSNCEITEVDNYRHEVFAAIPNLKYLDELDENNLEEPAVEELTNGEARESTGNVGEEEEEEDDDDEDEDDVEEASNDAKLVRPSLNAAAIAGVGSAAGAADARVFGADDDEDDEEGDYDYEEEEDDEDGDDDDDDEEDEEEEVGIEALQNSKELEDDEDDYAPPGGEGEDELDDEDEDEDDEDGEGVDESGVANLSAAGVTGPRRTGSKRPVDEHHEVASNGSDAAAPPVKLARAAAGGGDEVTSNGDTNDA